MKKAMALVAVVLAVGITVAVDAQAKRLGGASSGGMQRQQVTKPAAPPSSPGVPAQAAPAAGAAAAAAPAAAAGAAAKRSWAGPLAGLAAGLGLAALASYLGFGQALANVMLIALLAVAVLAVIGFVMRNRLTRGATPATAGTGGGSTPAGDPSPFGGTRIGSALGGSVAPAAATGAAPIPADFDVAGFARNASAQFMALQSANDARDLQRLRDYLTPEMFDIVREEVETRTGQQQTEVFGLNAQVVEVVEEADRYIVSVRFTGSVREQAAAVPEDLDEIWHLTKPRTGFGGWLVAGIQQVVPEPRA